jgi:hypothetical protein
VAKNLDRTKADMRAFMSNRMKDRLLHGGIETDEKKGHISSKNRSWRKVKNRDTPVYGQSEFCIPSELCTQIVPLSLLSMTHDPSQES